MNEVIRFLVQAVETMQLGVTVTGMDGRILYTNPADAEMHGYAPEELIGEHARVFSPETTAHPLSSEEARTARRWRRERTNVRKDGTTFPVRLLSDVVRDEEGVPIGIVTSCEDISEEKGAEARLEENAERLSALVAAQQEIARAEMDPERLVAVVARKAQELTSADGSSIELAEGQSFVQKAAFGIAEGRPGLRLSADASLSGMSARAGEPLVSEDTERDGRVDREACRSIGVRSLIALPLFNESRVIGILKVLSGRPGAFGPQDVHTLQLLTATVSAALRHALEFAASGALLADRTARLLASEERFASVFQLSAAGMALLTEDGRHARVNEAYATALGSTPEGLAGTPLESVLHEEDREAHRRAVESLLTRSFRSVHHEVRFVRADGKVVWMLESLALLSASPASPARIVIQTQDIGDRKSAEGALRASEEKYRLLFERNLAGVYRSTLEGKILDCNEAFARMFGMTREAILATPSAALYEDAALRRSFLRRLQEAKSLSNFEVRLRHKDGSAVWILENVTLLPGEGDGGAIIEGTAIDITDRKRAEEILVYDAFHDSLTGLANRALFMDRLGYVSRRSVRTKVTYAILFIDLDRFKLVNDSLGHVAGDRLLVAVARRLERTLRDEDTVARLGGDEFAVLLDGIGEQADVRSAAERILRTLAEPFEISGREVFASASIGIAVSSYHGGRPEDLLRDADTAMYVAKASAKGTAVRFEPEMRERAVAELELETALRRALERDELTVHYQPVFALPSRELRGFEALVRWNHPDRGLVLPAEFLRKAEETGLIVSIGSKVLEEACRQLAEWQRRFPSSPALGVSVNLSARELASPGLVDRVSDVLARTGIARGSLSLELTEGILVENPDLVGSLLGRLRALGIQVSLDDFGTGYSSLSYLHWLPLDRLKIDRTFVTSAASDEKNFVILRTIATLAENLGMEVVAEGIETADQLAQLGAIPCALGQGFLLSEPRDAASATALLAGSG